MKRTSFGPATVESGKNKGQARTLSFATGISTENANGLPIESGKVSLAISAAQPTVVTFETADEVRSTAGWRSAQAYASSYGCCWLGCSDF